MMTSGVVRRSVLMLGDIGLPAILTLDLLMHLLVVVLRIEKVTSYLTFLMMPTNRPVSSVDSLGKLLSSELN